MRYLVYGTGAVGGFVGGRLALTGHPVTFLARPVVAEAMRQDGLRLTGDDPGGHLPHPSVFSTLEECLAAGPFDAVLLSVKAYDCQAAAQALQALRPGAPPVVCLLNGIGNEQVLAQHLGAERVIAATLTTAERMLQPGVVSVDRQRGLGVVAGHPLSRQLCEEMDRAGLRARLYPDAGRLKWSKLPTNMVANATAGIVGWSPARIFDHPGLYWLEVSAIREAVRVMRGLGFPPHDLPGVPVRLLSGLVFLPPQLTRLLMRRAVASGRGDKPPSFQGDIGRGRSEVGWLNGAVARHGKELRLPTPANTVLTEVLLGLVESRIPREQFADRADRLLAAAEEAGLPGVRRYNPRDRAGADPPAER